MKLCDADDQMALALASHRVRRIAHEGLLIEHPSSDFNNGTLPN
jgi:hypothetical protein